MNSGIVISLTLTRYSVNAQMENRGWDIDENLSVQHNKAEWIIEQHTCHHRITGPTRIMSFEGSLQRCLDKLLNSSLSLSITSFSFHQTIKISFSLPFSKCTNSFESLNKKSKTLVFWPFYLKDEELNSLSIPYLFFSRQLLVRTFELNVERIQELTLAGSNLWHPE